MRDARDWAAPRTLEELTCAPTELLNPKARVILTFGLEILT